MNTLVGIAVIAGFFYKLIASKAFQPKISQLTYKSWMGRPTVLASGLLPILVAKSCCDEVCAGVLTQPPQEVKALLRLLRATLDTALSVRRLKEWNREMARGIEPTFSASPAQQEPPCRLRLAAALSHTFFCSAFHCSVGRRSRPRSRFHENRQGEEWLSHAQPG